MVIANILDMMQTSNVSSGNADSGKSELVGDFSAKLENVVAADVKTSQPATKPKDNANAKTDTGKAEDTPKEENEEKDDGKEVRIAFLGIPVINVDQPAQQPVAATEEPAIIVGEQPKVLTAVEAEQIVMDEAVTLQPTEEPLVETAKAVVTEDGAEMVKPAEDTAEQPKTTEALERPVAKDQLQTNAGTDVNAEPREPVKNERIVASIERPYTVAETEQAEQTGQSTQTQGTQQATAEEMPVMKYTVIHNAQATEENLDEIAVQAELPVLDALPEEESKPQVKADVITPMETEVDAENADITKQILSELNSALKNPGNVDDIKLEAMAKSVEDVNLSETSADAGEDTDSDDMAQQKQPSLMQQAAAATPAGSKTDFNLNAVRDAGQEPVPAQTNVRMQIVSQVRSMVSAERSELELQLNPHYLGGLKITLSTEENGMVAKLVTASKDAHNLIQNEMAALQETLRDKGINVVQMEVIYDQMANTTGKDSSNGQNWDGGNNSHGYQGRAPKVDTEGIMPGFDELSSYEILAEQGGSVEYSA